MEDGRPHPWALHRPATPWRAVARGRGWLKTASPLGPAWEAAVLHPSPAMSNAAYDDVTAEQLQRDQGKTAEVLRKDRENMFSSAPPARGVEDQMVGTAPRKGSSKERMDPVPKGFDPYMMNGKGPNDSRMEGIGNSNSWTNCVIA